MEQGLFFQISATFGSFGIPGNFPIRAHPRQSAVNLFLFPF
jgi:hypothetical protein